MQTFIVALVLLGPFVGYALAFRRPNRTRVHVITMSVLGAALPMTILCASWAAAGQSSLDLISWLLVGLGYGAFIGLCGLLARLLGSWLSRRQP
jgi:uncharacterized membrane protein